MISNTKKRNHTHSTNSYVARTYTAKKYTTDNCPNCWGEQEYDGLYTTPSKQ
ncbi:hypothetical protein [Aquimarina rhabdastrellae]